MSIYLLVGSQTQLARGLPWLQRFAKQTGMPLGVLVLGTQQKTLAHHVRSSLEDNQIQGPVEQVEEVVTAVTAHLRTNGCRLLVMVDDVDDEDFQAELFQRCGVKCVWLKTREHPPTSPQHVFVFDHEHRRIGDQISRRLLGISASLELSQSWSDQELADRKLLASRVSDLQRQRCDDDDLLWIPFGPTPSSEHHYDAARSLLSNSERGTIALVSRQESWDRSLAAQIRYWATHIAEPMDREARLELAQSLEDGSQPNLEFLGLISAASMLAAFGLLQNSAAVIIGAMLIAPLMTPILGAGLSLTHGNRPLFQTSLKTITLGFVGAFFASYLFGWLVRLAQMDVVTEEMWGRCNPTILDFCVGLVGGMAASYARTRSHLSSALAGAAIAAALVPPIATSGLQAAFGVWDASERGWPVVGPLILVSINVLTIMIGSSFVLYARGLGIDHSRGNKWATRMTVSLLTLVLLVLVWMLHPERLFQ